ncbi:hypothetical protein [Rhizobium sp. Leaf383]|uniref:hypothetical protein n=1 Tax=Rhizobium sp. Leaf383 TaxID=1736357 RepID=UPI0012E39DD3|nr:hypothetical protein [Rhizobium sp. Leaf383]
MDESLGRLWANNATDDEIAEAMGKPASAVKARVSRLRLGSRDRAVSGVPTADGKVCWTPSDDKELLRLRRQGLSARWIGVEMGRTPGSVRSRLLKIDYQRPSTAPRDHTSRRCMRCTAVFRSEGIGNRLCYMCTGYAEQARSQYD